MCPLFSQLFSLLLLSNRFRSSMMGLGSDPPVSLSTTVISGFRLQQASLLELPGQCIFDLLYREFRLPSLTPSFMGPRKERRREVREWFHRVTSLGLYSVYSLFNSCCPSWQTSTVRSGVGNGYLGSFLPRLVFIQFQIMSSRTSIHTFMGR